jgi:hypothetical protein
MFAIAREPDFTHLDILQALYILEPCHFELGGIYMEAL